MQLIIVEMKIENSTYLKRHLFRRKLLPKIGLRLFLSPEGTQKLVTVLGRTAFSPLIRAPNCMK